jgi:hypothetical protein
MRGYFSRVLIAAVVLGFLSAGTVFAQSKNAASLDIAPLARGIVVSDSDDDTAIFGLGAEYERLIAPHFSVGARLDFYAGTIFDEAGVYFGLAAQGRWYPLSEELEKLSIGASLGFETLTSDDDDAEYGGLTFGLDAGWKLFIKDKFYIEPSLGYLYTKGSQYGYFPSEWQIGLNLGLAF